MLRQEINLYRHFEEKEANADFLTWKRFLAFNAIITILLIIIYFFSVIELYYAKHKDQKLQIELARNKVQFEKTKSGMPQLFFNKDVNDAIKTMKSELSTQKKIIEILSKNTPFSQILTALSESIIPNVWLTSISIQKNGDDIMLKGSTIGTKVDEFLDNIKKNKLFSVYQIKLNEVKNSNPDSSDIRLAFEILLVKNS